MTTRILGLFVVLLAGCGPECGQARNDLEVQNRRVCERGGACWWAPGDGSVRSLYGWRGDECPHYVFDENGREGRERWKRLRGDAQ
jgi:hypothetical protein